MLFPTIDTDLLLLSENKDAFMEQGTYVFVSDPLHISICRDKRMTREFFDGCGLKTPKVFTNAEEYLGVFPCFIKPVDGRLSINAFRIDTREELFGIAQRIKNYVIQPFIDGNEFTIDVFCDMQSNPIYITPRQRVKVRGGEVLKTKICQDDVMIEEALRIIERFKPVGPITIQLIRQKETEDDYFIEINPRFGGGAPLSMRAGADSAKAILSLFHGKKLRYISKAAVDGILYSRYDQSVSISKNNENQDKMQTVYDILEAENYCENVEAVIFDMDDTLYSEKEYVQSGLEHVAKLFPEIPNAYHKLWSYFEKGLPAIDEFLSEEGIYSEILKKQCVARYVEHKPKLELYNGMIPMLLRLKDKGKKLCLITDGRVQAQTNKIDALHIREFFDEIIITDELAGNASPSAFRKPNVIAFKIMKARLQIPYSKMVYIGDNIKKDFIATNKLGMESIYFLNTDSIYYGKDRLTDKEEMIKEGEYNV
jgi:HAD superfamily hydrolase (TIGR01549 family)